MKTVLILAASYIALLAVSMFAAELTEPSILSDAQSEAPSDVELQGPYSELPLREIGETAPDPNQPLIEGYEPIGVPDWTSSPYRHHGWRFGIGPDVPDTDDDEFGLRADVAYEHADGRGKRAEFWLFNEEIIRSDFLVTTLYFDSYKRFFYHDAEIVLGGGFALGHLNFDSARYYGGGGSVVAEGFLPLLNGKRSDLGAVGKGRVGALLGGWDGNTNLTSLDGDWVLLVEEFSWGLEFRRRFRDEGGRYWYINLMREHRIWDGLEVSTSTDVLIDGTVLNVGTAW